MAQSLVPVRASKRIYRPAGTGGRIWRPAGTGGRIWRNDDVYVFCNANGAKSGCLSPRSMLANTVYRHLLILCFYVII